MGLFESMETKLWNCSVKKAKHIQSHGLFLSILHVIKLEDEHLYEK